MEQVILVSVECGGSPEDWPLSERAAELALLTKTVNARIMAQVLCRRTEPDASLFIGSGKTEEIRQLCRQHDCATVIFNNELSATQQRNLEQALDVAVIDRTQLILTIFARHAHSREGKLQVELAQLQYLLPRLTGKGIALSRTGGGIGTRGPGEQKLEVDRRAVRRRIRQVTADIENLTRRRAALRARRGDFAPTVALVGYTNAGKSTLLNAITGSTALVKDEMFSTLDPLTRCCRLPADGQAVLFTDTVGFLHELPHGLIEAFKATLESVAAADLLLLVIDAAAPQCGRHIDAIWRVLAELSCQDKPLLYVFNKIDVIAEAGTLAQLQHEYAPSVAISAARQWQVDELLRHIESRFSHMRQEYSLTVPHDKLHVLSHLYALGSVRHCEHCADGVHLTVVIPTARAKKLLTMISELC